MASLEGLERKTVKELKELLKEQGLPVGGRKAELVERLSSLPKIDGCPSGSREDAAVDHAVADQTQNVLVREAGIGSGDSHAGVVEQVRSNPNVASDVGNARGLTELVDQVLPGADGEADQAAVLEEKGVGAAAAAEQAPTSQSIEEEKEGIQGAGDAHVRLVPSTAQMGEQAVADQFHDGKARKPDTDAGVETIQPHKFDSAVNGSGVNEGSALAPSAPPVRLLEVEGQGAQEQRADVERKKQSSVSGGIAETLVEESVPKNKAEAAGARQEAKEVTSHPLVSATGPGKQDSDDSLSYGDEDDEEDMPDSAHAAVHDQASARKGQEKPPHGIRVHRESPRDAQERVQGRPKAGETQARPQRVQEKQIEKRTSSSVPLRPSNQQVRRSPPGRQEERTSRYERHSEQGSKRKRQEIVFEPGSGRDGGMVPASEGAEPGAKQIKQAKLELRVEEAGGPTRALHIEGLRRPLREVDLKALLSETGKLEGFWLDALKSHCYAVFSTLEEAAATYEAVDHKDWPPRCKSCMLPSYVSVAEAEGMIAAKGHAILTRTSSAVGGGQARVRRASSGSVPLREASADVAVVQDDAPRPADVDTVDLTERGASLDRAANGSVQQPQQPLPAPQAAAPLIELFMKTKTVPHIFWLPLTDAEVAAQKGHSAGQGEGPSLPPAGLRS